jgi:hypothetical protein
MADAKQEPAPCCELLIIAGESAGDESTLPDSRAHSRESNGPTGDYTQVSVRNGAEREATRRSQNAGEEMPSTGEAMSSTEEPTGCGKVGRVIENPSKSGEERKRQAGGGKPRKQLRGETARAGHDRRKISETQQ